MVTDITSQIGPIKYSETMEMDRRMREFIIPKHFLRPSLSLEDGTYSILQHFVVSLSRDVSE